MSKTRFTTKQLTTAAVIAAVYAALTLLLPIPQYGGVQLRVAEAMTVLPFFFPEAIPGLAVGCFLANLLGSPFVLDWIFGTLATLLAPLSSATAPWRRCLRWCATWSSWGRRSPISPPWTARPSGLPMA